MITITYIDGSTQSIDVDGSFYVVSLAEKNGKMGKITPMEKAEGLALDLSYHRRRGVSKVELNEPEKEGKMKYFAPIREKENVYAYMLKTEEYKKEKKFLRNKFRHVPVGKGEKLQF